MMCFFICHFRTREEYFVMLLLFGLICGSFNLRETRRSLEGLRDLWIGVVRDHFGYLCSLCFSFVGWLPFIMGFLCSAVFVLLFISVRVCFLILWYASLFAISWGIELEKNNRNFKEGKEVWEVVRFNASSWTLITSFFFVFFVLVITTMSLVFFF